jgi:hypothetical protein
MQKTDYSFSTDLSGSGVTGAVWGSNSMSTLTVHDINVLPANKGVEVIANMLLVDDAKDYRDVMKNKLWADLFVELQKGGLGHDDGLHLDALIEGLITLCFKRSSAADDDDKRFYMDCISKFTQLLIFINTPQSLTNKPYMKRDEAVKQLKGLCAQGKC